jgi:hypothetical protein
MEKQPPVRKKWSERQFELFIETTRELGPETSQEDFERLLDRLLPPQEPRRRRSKTNGDGGRREGEP